MKNENCKLLYCSLILNNFATKKMPNNHLEELSKLSYRILPYNSILEFVFQNKTILIKVSLIIFVFYCCVSIYYCNNFLIMFIFKLFSMQLLHAFKTSLPRKLFFLLYICTLLKLINPHHQNALCSESFFIRKIFEDM